MSTIQPPPPISVPAECDRECLDTPFWDGRTPAIVDGVILLSHYWDDTLTPVTHLPYPTYNPTSPTSPAYLPTSPRKKASNSLKPN